MRGDILNILILIVKRWVMSETSMAETSRRTQHILFQNSAPRIFWYQQNLDLLSVNIEIQGTYAEIEKGHQGPALPLSYMSCISTLLLCCEIPLTQISSTYSTILSKMAAPVMDKRTSCPNVSAENTVRISYRWSFHTWSYSPQSYITPTEAATAKPQPRLIESSASSCGWLSTNLQNSWQCDPHWSMATN